MLAKGAIWVMQISLIFICSKEKICKDWYLSMNERLWIAFGKLEIKQHMKLVFCLGAY